MKGIKEVSNVTSQDRVEARAHYDDILAEYNALYPDRLPDWKSTIQKEEFSSYVDVTHALKSGKCGV